MKLIENLTTEFKREYTDDLKKTVIAFANTDGGKIYIGIEDDGSVVGVSDLDATMLKATNTIRDSIKPDLTLFVKCFAEVISGIPVLVLDVQKGSSCPYYISDKGIRPEGVYIRHGAASIPATESAILKMIREANFDSYELRRSLNQDLTFEAAQKLFNAAQLDFGKTQMKTLGLTDADDLYTNLALLLSDQCVHTIKLALFEGTTKTIFKDRHEMTGSLLSQLAASFDWIDRYNRTRAEIVGLHRIDTRDYPVEAIRETLLNALVHREYAFSGSTLISIYDDRMEFVTLGGLTNGITYNDIMLGASILRNEKLAHVFYRLKLIEAFGTGMLKIMRCYDAYAVKPLIQVSDNVFKITLPNVNQTISTKSSDIYLTENEKVVYNLFKESYNISRKDVEAALRVSQPMAVRILKQMTDRQLIQRLGAGKNTIYKPAK